jgi:hypothetical protein
MEISHTVESREIKAQFEQIVAEGSRTDASTDHSPFKVVNTET